VRSLLLPWISLTEADRLDVPFVRLASKFWFDRSQLRHRLAEVLACTALYLRDDLLGRADHTQRPLRHNRGVGLGELRPVLARP
jgi:hypothetical protein